MNKLYALFLLTLLYSCQPKTQDSDQETLTSKAVADIIPSLEEMSSIWTKCDTLGFMPSVRNFRGQAVANRDLTSISWFNAPPYSQGYHTGTMNLDGNVVMADQSRWHAYGTERKTTYKGLEILSDYRMVFEENGMLWNVTFNNPTSEDITFELTQDVIGFFGKYETQWQWWYPLPSVRGNEKSEWESDFLQPFKKNLFENELVRDSIGITPQHSAWPSNEEIMNSELYQTAVDTQNIPIIKDTNSAARVAYAFVNQPAALNPSNSGATATWTIIIPAGKSKNHSYTMAWGDDEATVQSEAKRYANDFDNVFASVKTNWKNKWIALFTPDNDFVSGNMPALETKDKRASRVYYTSALTMLYLTNTNMPTMKRVVLTGGPSWGGSIQFFWDTTSWRTIGATTDPEIMLATLKDWLFLDINKIYGRDYLSGKGVGYRYVANYWAIFQMLHEYLVVTGDYDFLKEEINGKTILAHMDDMAYNWKSLSMEGEEGYEGDVYKLADFGGDKNALLEAVPNYKHIVVSFNAGYVGMMKRLSEMYAKLGEEKKSKQAKEAAASMAERVLQLYAGNGIWYGLFPNNEKFEIKHILDFHFAGRYLSDELTSEMKEEMIHFVESELMTESWMRAQAKDDIAAEVSDRPDHGPLGAYDGWPLNTMEAMYHMGYPEKAMDFYRAVYPVTLEGTWAQAHELWGENKYEHNARVRIARRGLCVRDAASGIAFANVMLREFFGFAPEFMDDQPLDNPEMVRSIQGKMHHVRYEGKLYTIISDENGLQLIEE